MQKIITVLSLLPLYFCLASGSDTLPLAQRIPYDIPLVKLSLTDNSTAIRIVRNDHGCCAVIRLFDDQLTVDGKRGITKTIYKEPGDYAENISAFEAENILFTTKALIATLEGLERNLQQKKWGQCLYLDGFLPKFLRDYCFLLGISRNSTSRYTPLICLFEDKFDKSLNSRLTDERINRWKSDQECLMKVRISSKELAHQLQLWEKKELAKPAGTQEIGVSSNVEEALELFIRIYFIIPNSATCPHNGIQRRRK